MVSIVISPAAKALLDAHSTFGRCVGDQRQDGQFVIDVDEEVADRLAAIDPDPSAAIVLLCGVGAGNA